ncbi:transglutaminase family protein [Pseudomaricurvus alkylphenolicus]|jgi:transglutaminase-like putative cysteine protease|uniref:transglutaminase family protein n=1 Tax=Pseudomaricurvus alkylphenolicus TaxID=1306991 RepID=UPI0014241086|nr:transglutaminase family protein [Pseudomaricurvus alkylphenolicus]NIB43084.1 transglutaminase family protein [Pseudomaricurvus alkylphenolicus]
MRYRVKHITEYLYSDSVSHCYNLAHMIPRSSLRQTCLHSDVKISPMAAHSSRREDYFGNQAYHFEIQRPHKKLVITATSDVETQEQSASVDLDLGITCAEAREQLAQSTRPDLLLSKEFILDSSMIRVNDELRDFATPSFEDDRPLLSATMELTRRIFKEFTYCPESTTIATPLADVLKNRKGVCQDFAHLQIGCLRALGFPAKYVSGYLETLPPPGKEKLVGADASHAWLSVYSPTEGWFEFDPTNNCLASEQHIITAWGRDFYDVTPLKGVIFGGGESPVLNVSVDVARV